MKNSKRIMALKCISTEDLKEDLSAQDFEEKEELSQYGESDITFISDSIDVADQTVNCLELITEHLSLSSGLNQKNAQVVNIAITHLLNQIDYAKPSILAMESFGGTMTKAQGTSIAIESIKQTIREIWEAIKKSFNLMFDWIFNFFKKIFNIGTNVLNSIKTSIDEINQYVQDAKDHSKLAIEALNENEFDIDKSFTIDAGRFGQYLGNNKKEIEHYISDLSVIDNCILETIKNSVDYLDINLKSTNSSFMHPFTIEQKDFFKNKIPFTSTEARVVPLAFKKGFIWKIEGASLHSNKNNTEMFQVNGGVHRTNHVFDIEELECLTVAEITTYLSKLKNDLEDNGKNTHILASNILKSINLKIKEIEKLETETNNIDPEKFKNNKVNFLKAKHSLNTLKNIEIGYWQYKNESTLKIKEYCDASIRTRRKDLKDFNTV